MNSTSISPEMNTPYGYTPSRGAAIVFITLFGLSMIAHSAQAIKYRMWWLFPTMVACTLTEIIGWSGRLWSSYTPQSLDPYLMQICGTIFAPSFMTAATFTILGKIIPRLGSQYSWLTPRLYLIIFVTADIGALVIQSVGGAQAATAAKKHKSAEDGGHIMVGGIIFQMVAITLFVICATEFLTRYFMGRPVRSEPTARGTLDKRMKLMLIGLVVNTIFIYIRSIYRTIELLDGWNGEIIRNQALFNLLDGVPIVLACITFNIFHPGYLLGNDAASPLGNGLLKTSDAGSDTTLASSGSRWGQQYGKETV